MTHEYQERMARQILGERQFNTEIDSWLREVRANAYVEIKDPSLDKRTYKSKSFYLHQTCDKHRFLCMKFS